MFDVKVISSDPKTIGCLWLFEKDGDAWQANWAYDALQPDIIPVGWSRVRVPVTSFSFDPRGQKTQELASVVRLLIGFTAGRADVLISRLRFEVQPPPETAPLPVTANFAVDRSGSASIAILSADYPHRVSDSDPAVLAATLKRAGYGVTLINLGDLADRAVFNRAHFDALILPYGGRYPVAANDSIRSFLKARGALMTTGGYAFDEAIGATLPTVKSLGAPIPPPLGSRQVSGSDVLIIGPGQTPLFDTGNLLQRVATTRAASGQSIVPQSVRLADGPISGYAATAMLGNSHALAPQVFSRRIPLLMAYDKVGRERGAAGALVYNFAGAWRGSSFAIFGVTSTDLFASGGPLISHLPHIVKALIDRIYIRNLRTEFRHYEAGETVRCTASFQSESDKPVNGVVTFTVADRSGAPAGQPVAVKVVVLPHTRTPVEANLGAAKADSDLYTVSASFSSPSGDDVMRTGYTVARKDIGKLGFQLAWRDNYFQDGTRPLLAAGVNMTSSVLNSDLENPAQWDTDMARVRETGLSVIRVLNLNPWIDTTTHVETIPTAPFQELPKGFLRTIDSFVQLAQLHHLALLFSLCDWGPRVAVSQADRDMQVQVAKLLTEHFRGIPGIFFDLKNEPSMKADYSRATSDNRKKYEAAWTAFLTARYGTDKALAMAWGVEPGQATLASAPLFRGKSSWTTRRTIDYDDFWADILGRWADGLSTAIRSVDPSRLNLIGFLEGYTIINKARAQESLSLASLHSYAAADDVRNDIQLFDHRATGQGTSITEYGDTATHAKRRLGIDNGTSDAGRFLRTAHNVYGAGGFLTAWWLWKDMDDTTFPWGLNYSGNGPRKDTALATRNTMLMLRAVRPLYQPAALYVVADAVQLGAASGPTAVKSFFRIFDELRARQIEFGVIDSRHLDKLPASSRVLIYPVAFCMPDGAYAALRKFAADGGTVCVGGDFSYDEWRNRTHTDRVAEFGGFTVKSPGPDPWVEPSDISVTSAVLQGGATVNAFGKGKVYATLDPGCVVGNGFAFAAALDTLAVKRLTEATPVIVTRLPETSGARSYFAYNPTTTAQAITVTAERIPVTITLGAYGVGFARYDSSGNVTSIESQGHARIGSITVPMTGHFALVAPQFEPLTTAASMVAVPFGAGTLDLTGFPALKNSSTRSIDIRDGQFIECGEQQAPTIVVDAETGYELRIVASPSMQQRVAEWVRDEIELRPSAKGDTNR